MGRCGFVLTDGKMRTCDVTGNKPTHLFRGMFDLIRNQQWSQSGSGHIHVQLRAVGTVLERVLI